MNISKPFSRIVSATGILGIVAVGGAVLLLVSRGDAVERQPSPLALLSQRALNASGLNLTVPKDSELAKAEIGRAVAEETAIRQFGGGQILESRILYVQDEFGGGGGSICLCWVVSSKPAGGNYIHQPVANEGEGVFRFTVEQEYRLDMIDAVSGVWLYAASGAVGHDVWLSPEEASNEWKAANRPE